MKSRTKHHSYARNRTRGQKSLQYNDLVNRHRLGSPLLHLKGLAVGIYLAFALWPGSVVTPFQKAIFSIFLLVFLLSWADAVGYADERGIHYRKLIRSHHLSWPEVEEAEWDPEDMALCITAGDTVIRFKYRGIAALFGSRQRPEAINFTERKLAESSAGRFVCKTLLTA